MSGFHQGVERAIPALRRYARALTRDAETADDLVQDTLVRALRSEHLFHGGDVPYGGSNPADVIDCVVHEGWSGVLGNTDEMLWDNSARPALEASGCDAS